MIVLGSLAVVLRLLLYRVSGGGMQWECTGDTKKAQAGPGLSPASPIGALPCDVLVYHKRGPGRAPKDANGVDVLWDTGIGAWVDGRAGYSQATKAVADLSNSEKNSQPNTAN